MTSPNFFALTNASVAHGDLTVVWDVSLRLEPGRTTALLGRNGAGKTTLVSALAGLLPLRSGSLEFEGQDISRRSAWNRMHSGIVLVQEGKRVLRQLTVQENLLLGVRRGLKHRESREAIDRVYDRFPVLRDRARSMAGLLSGGQQQLLALGTAMASAPRVLLIDEPSSGLAPRMVEEVLAAVDQFKADGAAVLLVEQLVHEVMSGYADDVVVLEQGRVKVSRPASEVTLDEVLAGVYGRSPESIAAEGGDPGN
ncbi:ABC transporter ATP-binding protein [Spirillospora sp. CA-255316]